jgi:hypothetical protein
MTVIKTANQTFLGNVEKEAIAHGKMSLSFSEGQSRKAQLSRAFGSMK